MTDARRMIIDSALLAIALAIFGIGWYIASSATRSVQSLRPQVRSSRGEYESIIHDVSRSPSDYVGQTVSVTGTVVATDSNGLVYIGDNVLGDKIMVLTTRLSAQNNAAQDISMLKSNNEVNVVGVIHYADVEQLRSSHKLDISPDLEKELASAKAVLVADKLTDIDSDRVYNF